MTTGQPPTRLDEHPAPNLEFARLASTDRVLATAAALERNGIRALVLDTGQDARQQVRELLPEGGEVFNATSQTLQTIGVAQDVERSGRYRALRPRLYQMDRLMQGREMRKEAAAPDYFVGSVHAVTERGSLLIASASGSQLGPLVSGAGTVILVVGAQKIVPDLETGMRRIEEYCYPLEDARARQAYGISSGINNVLIVNRQAPGRVIVILVGEQLGF
jgi:LUD domain